MTEYQMTEYQMAVSVAEYHKVDFVLWCDGCGITIKNNGVEMVKDLKECRLKIVDGFTKHYTFVEFTGPIQME